MTAAERLAEIRRQHQWQFHLTTIDRESLRERAHAVVNRIATDHRDVCWLLSRLALAEKVVEAARGESSKHPRPGYPCHRGDRLAEWKTGCSCDQCQALAAYDAGGGE